ncbi:unnamed protein product, partial [Amoebophrya sp. A120]
GPASQTYELHAVTLHHGPPRAQEFWPLHRRGERRHSGPAGRAADDARAHKGPTQLSQYLRALRYRD